MTHKAITLKFVVPTALAIALGIMISIGAVHYAVPIDQADANHSVANSRGIAALPNSDVRLSRVRLLLSSMK
jgi:chemotaxis protein histidine kinase CheA